jgi:hypothetical protein
MLEIPASFKAQFNLKRLRRVHSTPLDRQRTFLEEVAPKLDVLVHQPIREDYRAEEAPIFGSDHAKSHTNATAISFPSLHFFGYHPRSKSCTVTSPEADAFCRREFGQTARGLVHHRQIVRNYLFGRDIAEAVSSFDRGEAEDAKQALVKVEDTLDHMRHAEKRFDIDIPMSGFIAERFRDQMLFHVPAHPGGEVLCEVARRILELLSVKVTPEEIERMRRLEPLGFIQHPLQSYVREALNLSFPGPRRFVFRGQVMTKPQMVERYYALYDLFDDDMWLGMSRELDAYDSGSGVETTTAPAR